MGVRTRLLKRPATVAAFLFVALAVLGTPALLFAHARLVRSSPAANARLTTRPTGLGLWFSEKPELQFTTVTLTDSAGKTIALGAPVATESMGLNVPVTTALPNGKYTVSWRTAAADGHVSSGTFSFVVDAAGSAPAAPGAPVAPATPTITIDTSRPKGVSNAVIQPSEQTTFNTGMRWAEYVALLFAIGIISFRLAVIPQAKLGNELVAELSDRSVRMIRALLVLFIVATLTRGFAQAELLPAAESRMDAMKTLVNHTGWGFGWAIGAIGALIALLSLLAVGRSLAGWLAAAIGVIAVCVSESLTGHSATQHYYALAIATDVAHVLGAGAWLGGLTALLICGMPSVRKLSGEPAAKAGSKLLASYHSTAVDSVAIVVITGLIAAWMRLPALSALWTTPYGSTLFRKIMFVLFALAFGLYHWRRVVIVAWTDDVRRRFQRSAIAELLIGAIIVAFTAVLVSQHLP